MAETVTLKSQASSEDWVDYAVDINEDSNTTNGWRLFYVKEPGDDEEDETTYAQYAIGSPTLEMWIAAWNSKYGSDVFSGGKILYYGRLYTNTSGNEATNFNGWYILQVRQDIAQICFTLYYRRAG